MGRAKTAWRGWIPVAAYLFLAALPASAGGVAIVSHTLVDNGDDDGFADTGETAQVFLTVRNTSGGPLINVTASVYGLNPGVACTTKSTLVIGNLAYGQTVTTTDYFEFTVGAGVDRTALGLSPYDALSAEFEIDFYAGGVPAAGFPPDLSFDLDLDVSGGSGPTTYVETFENFDVTPLGSFEVSNLDAGRYGLTPSDGHRCQYNDPDNPNGNAPGRSGCHLGSDPSNADSVWWQLSGPSFSPMGGRGFSGFHSLFFGFDDGPPLNWSTPLAVLEGAGMTDPVHIARDAVAPTLTWKHQVSLADHRDFNLPHKTTYDRGVVMVQVADDLGNGAGPWFKVDPYQNPYDQQNFERIINCGFDPVDDGNTEDDFFAPGDPNRKLGPSSTCYPEPIYASIGETSALTFDAAAVGQADGPGLQGLWGIGTWIESKVDLSRFRGRSIRVRYVVSTLEANPGTQVTWQDFIPDPGPEGPLTGDDGWWIDDVEVSELVTSPATVAKDDKDNGSLPGPGGADPDSDGLVDSCDNCPLDPNAPQADGDLDGYGDVCDVCPYNANNVDPDMDAVCAEEDNCPNASNPSQTDVDLDGYGAACDCDDTDFFANPGVVESNDGLDEDCDGVSDELHDVAGAKSGAQATFSWPAQASALRYQAVRSSSAQLDSACSTQNLFAATSHADSALPAAGGVYYYVFRATHPNAGSWGLDGDSVERGGTCLP